MKTLLRLFVSHGLAALMLAAQVDVVTNRYDANTTGANTRETALNTHTVNSAGFGKLFSYYVDGAVYAQPLYLSSLSIAGRGRLNVLFVATMNDKLYAFDADMKGPPLWMRDFTDELAGITPVPIIDITNSNGLNLVGNVGIEGSPVIDGAAGMIYLVARTKENGNYVQRLHKLRVSDGKDDAQAAVIEASVKGTAQDAVDGLVRFDPKAGNQRPALVLVNGAVVIAWASHEDIRPYHGWIMSYDAATLKQTGALCITPDLADGGVWQSGRAPAVDANGNVYFETGNGGWDGKRNFGTSVVKLHLSGDGLTVADFFTPGNYEELNEKDADVGSTGCLLIPGTNVLACGNKKGVIFTLDCDHMSEILGEVAVNGGRVMAGPAYWDGPNGGRLFVWNETDYPKAFRLNGHAFETEPVAKGTVASHGSPGGALTVSSDGNKAGSGVLWGTISQRSADHGNAPGTLYAFDAETLHELWSSEQKAARDRLGTLVKFVPPLVAAGKVYVPNYDNAVNVYGPLAGEVRPAEPRGRVQ